MRGPSGRAAAVLAISLVVLGCGADANTPVPTPSEQPTFRPIATATTLPPGPLTGVGPLARATYLTPTDFKPSFSFEIHSDAWRSATPPDQFGFALVTPSLIRVHAIIALAVSVSATIDAFEQELTDHGVLGAADPAVVTDLQVGGIPARSFALTRTDPVESFAIRVVDAETMVTLGGPLFENRIVYVATAAGPIVLLLNLDADNAAETRFVFDSMLGSIAFN